MNFQEAVQILDLARLCSAHEQQGNRVEIVKAMKVALVECKDEVEFYNCARNVVLFSEILYFVMHYQHK